jgi:nucleoside 2-deoxyribosyltransferase
MSQILKIYLAGPDVFLPDPVEAGKKKKALCIQYGFEGLFPLDNILESEGKSLFKMGLEISKANENLIRQCQMVIANITPFRGPSADAGTIYEIGFARALNLPVFAYSNTTKLFSERTLSSFNLIRDPLKINVIRDHNNMSVEDFGMTDNLMIEGGILSSGGKIITTDVPDHELYTNLQGFEKCLQSACDFFKISCSQLRIIQP